METPYMNSHEPQVCLPQRWLQDFKMTLHFIFHLIQNLLHRNIQSITSSIVTSFSLSLDISSFFFLISFPTLQYLQYTPLIKFFVSYEYTQLDMTQMYSTSVFDRQPITLYEPTIPRTLLVKITSPPSSSTYSHPIYTSETLYIV